MVQTDFQFIADLPAGYVVVGADIEGRGKLKKVENLEMSTVGHGIWQEN